MFPGVTLPKSDRGTLEDALLDSIARRQLQPVPWFVEKIVQVRTKRLARDSLHFVLQIYEMMLVRHGFMIVGGTLGGKTSAFKTLAESLGELNECQMMDEFKVSPMSQRRIYNGGFPFR